MQKEEKTSWCQRQGEGQGQQWLHFVRMEVCTNTMAVEQQRRPCTHIVGVMQQVANNRQPLAVLPLLAGTQDKNIHTSTAARHVSQLPFSCKLRILVDHIGLERRSYLNPHQERVRILQRHPKLFGNSAGLHCRHITRR